MKHRLLPILFLLAIVGLVSSTRVDACEKNTSKTSAAATTASAHDGCTAEQAAACKAKGASAATAAAEGECAMHHMKGASAVTASSDGDACVKHKASSASAQGCTSKMSATTAASGACKGKGVMIAAGMCGNGEKASAMAAGSGGACNGHGMMKDTGRMTHAKGDCDACVDMVNCEDQLKAASSQTQVVPLKNGVMFVYTADNPGKVRAVQAAMAHRYERLTAIAASGEKAHLCPECKTMRGAVASGKLSREVVNIEGGCLTLMTSTDPAIVAKLHALAGVQSTARFKS